jgi:hypothetical protein
MDKKITIGKSITEMEEEARIKHMIKLLHQKGDQMYVSFREPGQVIRFQDGKRYQIHEDGSLRRVNEK